MPSANGPFNLDASVFLSAANPSEVGHAESRRLIEFIRRERVPVVVPTLILPKVTAGTRRGGGSADVARHVASAIVDGTALILVALDEGLASAAADIAADSGIKGSDAVYGATARRFASTLVTLDRQQRERMPADIITATPAAAVGDQGAE